MSQARLARELGATERTIKRWESDDNMPEERYRQALAHLAGAALSFPEEKPPPRASRDRLLEAVAEVSRQVEDAVRHRAAWEREIQKQLRSQTRLLAQLSEVAVTLGEA